jgi:prevent-host-death family protein
MAKTIVNIHEAKTNLSRLIMQVESGGEVIIARAGKPAVKLIALVEVPLKKRRIGFLAGQFRVPDDFNEMGRAAIEEMFHGDPDKELREKLEKKKKKKKR